MKFLFVGTNPENTGAAAHFVALATAMAEAGHEVGAVAFPGGMIAQGLADRPGVRVYPGKFRNVLDPRGYTATLKAAWQLKPDWLVGNFGKEYWPLILLSRLLHVPLALFRHRTPAMSRVSGYLVPRLAQRFYAVSWYARQAYLDRGVPPHLVRVLYNPVNTHLLKPDLRQRDDVLRSLGIPADAIVVGYFGRVHASKGIGTLLQAVQQAMEVEPRLHCLWLGDGPDLQPMRELAAASPHASRHHMLGWIHDTHPYYSAISMLAFPSIAPETFCRVSVEAQACAAPVLASNVGGVPETLLPDTTGLLLPPGDVAAWRAAILRLCDPSVRLPMGVAARDFVLKRFSMPVIAADFLRTLQSRQPVGRPPLTPKRPTAYHA